MDVIVTVRFRVPNLYNEKDLEVEPGRTPLDFALSWLADGYDLREQEQFEVISVEPVAPK
jgi:hypothetical protein